MKDTPLMSSSRMRENCPVLDRFARRFGMRPYPQSHPHADEKPVVNRRHTEFPEQIFYPGKFQPRQY
jgi:hypothetical protein